MSTTGVGTASDSASDSPETLKPVVDLKLLPPSPIHLDCLRSILKALLGFRAHHSFARRSSLFLAALSLSRPRLL